MRPDALRIASCHVRVVVSIAQNYTSLGMPFLDMTQHRNIGLLRCTQKFDRRKGYEFSTSATWLIRLAVTRTIAGQARAILFPVHIASDNR